MFVYFLACHQIQDYLYINVAIVRTCGVPCCSLAVDLSYTGMQYEDEEDDFRVDFDYFGYLRNPEEYRRIRSTGVLNMDDEDVCNLSRTDTENSIV